jgi:hypothetical protein
MKAKLDKNRKNKSQQKRNPKKNVLKSPHKKAQSPKIENEINNSDSKIKKSENANNPSNTNF